MANPGLSSLTRAGRGFDSLRKYTGEGTIAFGTPFLAFQITSAERGHMAGEAVSGTLSMLMTPLVAGVIGAVIAVALPGIGTGIGVSLIVSALAGAATEAAVAPIGHGITGLTKLGRDLQALHMGGSYQDTQLAQRQRFLAVQQMNSAMPPARRYLGQEALLMHR
jgi:hypothetical protein